MSRTTNGFDFSELTRYQRKMLRLAEEKMPKESKKFLRKEGTKLRKKTLSTAKSKVKKKTGNYFKGIKRGKVYKYGANGALSIRVYGASPHAHLIEYGHKQVTEDGKEVGFVEGQHVFRDAQNEFQNEFFNDARKFIDELIDKGLR